MTTAQGQLARVKSFGLVAPARELAQVQRVGLAVRRRLGPGLFGQPGFTGWQPRFSCAGFRGSLGRGLRYLDRGRLLRPACLLRAAGGR
jgi:hypothetical protein